MKEGIQKIPSGVRAPNTVSEESKHQSHEEKYTYISPYRMEKILNTYNNNYHSTIKCTPQEMFNDHNLEKEYILKCMDRSERQKRIKDLILPIGSFVRVHTHTQCVFHIIRLRLIIFHTPKNFHGRNKIE